MSLSGRGCLRVLLVVFLGSMSACNSVTNMGNTGNSGLLDPDGGGLVDPAETPKPASGEEPEPGIQESPDQQPGEPGEPGPEALPDFSAPDVNPNSAHFGEVISPRDYLEQVSAWYFGHST